MPVITINGPIGSSTVEVGHLVSEILQLDYVDRQVLAQAARLVNSPVAALVHREQRPTGFRDRLSRLLTSLLEQESYVGLDFGLAAENLPAESFAQLGGAGRVDDNAFIAATSTVIKELADGGDVVIIGRNSNLILADTPGVFHVGLLASERRRIANVMRRDHLSQDEAETYLAEAEKARINLSRKVFKTNPNDPSAYHLMLNLGATSDAAVADIIIRASQGLFPG